MDAPGLNHAQVLRRLTEIAADAIRGSEHPDSPYELARRVIRHAGFALRELGENGQRAAAARDLRSAYMYADQIAKSCNEIGVPALDIESAVTVHAVVKLVAARVHESFPPHQREAGEKIAEGLQRLSIGLQGWGVHDSEQVRDNVLTAGGHFVQAVALFNK